MKFAKEKSAPNAAAPQKKVRIRARLKSRRKRAPDIADRPFRTQVKFLEKTASFQKSMRPRLKKPRAARESQGMEK